MSICQLGMHKSVQDHTNAKVCKQTYDRAAVCVWGPEAILKFPDIDIDEFPNGWVSSEEQLHSVLRMFEDNHNIAPQVILSCPPGLHCLVCDLLLMCQHAAQTVCVRLLDHMPASLLAHIPACPHAC